MIKKEHYKIRGALIILLTLVSIFCIFPLKDKISLGLDLKGGMYILLRADTSNIPKEKLKAAINGAIEKVRARIDSFGVKETTIQLQGSNYILVQVPKVVDRQIIKKLREVGKLEFKLVEDDPQKLKQASEGKVPQGYELKEYNSSPILLEKKAVLTGSDLKESFVGFGNYGESVVRLTFTSGGRKKFAKITGDNIGRRLAIVLDGKVMSAPSIREQIAGGEAEITGNFTDTEAKALVSVLNSGALPLPLYLEQERTVGPLLGSDSVRKGLYSIGFGAALVVIFMLIYYFMGGGVAVICLILDLLFILAGLRILKATLTLPGIAGIILTIGMAVDANVLIFERIREELLLDKPLSLAVRNGFDRAKRTIFDANITTLVAALFLFIYGTGPIRGFATTLSLGIMISIFTAVFVARTIFSLLLERGWKKFKMLNIFHSPKINFLNIRYLCFIVSGILILTGMGYFLFNRNELLGIDFKGGQILEYKITPPVKIASVRQALAEGGLAALTIQEFSDIKGGISIKAKSDISAEVTKVLKKKFKNVQELKITTIGPAVGKIMKRKAYLAVLLSLLGIMVYVMFRFKHFDFAFAGVIALFHDILIVSGFLALAKYEITLLTITSLLTIAGYSINDTIVIYDRIREISTRFPKLSLEETINRALNSTLSRTIVTSLTTFMVIAAIYLFGGEALRGFSFALGIGVITGTYSSIYIASALCYAFRKKSFRNK